MNRYRIAALLALALVPLGLTGMRWVESVETCDVKDAYRKIEAPSQSVGVSYGQVVPLDLVLAPASLRNGRYRVSLTREADDLFVDTGTRMYFATTLCSRFATFEDATIVVPGRGLARAEIRWE